MQIAAILGIIQGIQMAIALAPKVVEIVTAGKNLITSLFSAGLITKEQQDAIHAHLDSYAALWAAGIPVHWTIEPDPT